MKHEVEDFIREEESAFQNDDSVVCTCDYCGDLILVGQDMMVFVAKDGTGMRLCEKCYNSIAPDEILELANIWNCVSDSESAEGYLLAKLTQTEEST